LGVLVDFFKFYLQPASPLAIVIVFGLGAVWAYAQPRSRGPRRYLAAAVFGYWLMATPIGAGALSWGLAHGLRQIATREEAHGATAVVVLGGGAYTLSGGGQVVGALTTGSIFRALEGARVSKLIGASLVVASGGRPDPEIQLKPESDMIRATLVDAGVPHGTIVEESASRTTRDQAREIAPMLRAKGVRQFVLITSPVHMRRSLGVFRLEGFDPVPSVSLTRSEHLRPPSLWLPDGASLNVSQEAIYDYAAMLYYWGRGWR
jgi:uncharacterized SAM-binding protein YcdF (DUF218 family)